MFYDFIESMQKNIEQNLKKFFFFLFIEYTKPSPKIKFLTGPPFSLMPNSSISNSSY